MKLLRLGVAAAFSTVALVAPASSATEQGKPEMSDNVKHVASFPYTGGTELAAIGKYVYSGEQNGADRRGQDQEKGGMHIFDVGGKPKEVGFLHCPGNDNDVEVIKAGLVALSFHSNTCAPAAANGFMIIDVKNPKKPKILSQVNTQKNHTFKPFPGKPLIYTAGGGLAGGPNAGPAIVDVSNPRKPEIVARPKTITMDCHDISFSLAGDTPLGFCAGAIGTGEVQIWDVSDPLEPTTIARIVNPAIQYSHYAVASRDGKLLAIDDEAFALHECYTGHSPTGRVWVYDISTPEVPLLQGSFAAPRGGGGPVEIGTYPGWVPSWCLSHGLDWHPKANFLATTWFTGGVSVLDFTNPTMPREHAYFKHEKAATYSVLWHDGHLFTNDMFNGVDMMKVDGIK